MTSLGLLPHISHHHLVQLPQLGLCLEQSPLSALMTSQHSYSSHMLLLMLTLITKLLHTWIIQLQLM